MKKYCQLWFVFDVMEPGPEEEGATGVTEFNVAALAQVSDANPYCTLANFEIEKKIGQGQVRWLHEDLDKLVIET